MHTCKCVNLQEVGPLSKPDRMYDLESMVTAFYNWYVCKGVRIIMMMLLTLFSFYFRATKYKHFGRSRTSPECPEFTR